MERTTLSKSTRLTSGAETHEGNSALQTDGENRKAQRVEKKIAINQQLLIRLDLFFLHKHRGLLWSSPGVSLFLVLLLLWPSSYNTSIYFIWGCGKKKKNCSGHFLPSVPLEALHTTLLLRFFPLPYCLHSDTLFITKWSCSLTGWKQVVRVQNDSVTTGLCENLLWKACNKNAIVLSAHLRDHYAKGTKQLPYIPFWLEQKLNSLK